VERRDFEFSVRGNSKSLKVAPADKSYATFYQSAIATTALSSIVF